MCLEAFPRIVFSRCVVPLEHVFFCLCNATGVCGMWRGSSKVQPGTLSPEPYIMNHESELQLPLVRVDCADGVGAASIAAFAPMVAS